MEAAVSLPLATLAVRILGFQRVRRLLNGSLRRCGGTAVADDTVTAVVRGLRIATRYCLYRPVCLPRALVLCRMLRRRGVDACVRIGVRREKGRLAAHAWVEWGGLVVGEGAEVRGAYSAFDRVVA